MIKIFEIRINNFTNITMGFYYKDNKLSLNYNSKKEYLVILFKWNRCGACINFLENIWPMLINDSRLQHKIDFLTFESTEFNGRHAIDKISEIVKRHYDKSKTNNPDIKYFPTILIFKKCDNAYDFLEKFNYDRIFLKLHLENLISII